MVQYYYDLDTRYMLKDLDATTATDPALNAAVSTTIIDAYSGVIITLTGAGNAQTLQSPTDTSSIKRFVVVANDTNGANTIAVNGITLSAGEAQWFLWDGSAWIAITAVDADDIAFTPTGNISSTTVQAAIAEVDSEKTTLTTVKADSDVSDAISKKHSQNTDTGTSSTTFQVGTDGPKVKNNSGVLEARNAADDAYADFKAKVLDFTGTSETIVAHGNTGTDAQEIDLADGSYHTMTVTGDFTISFTGWPSGKVGTVIVKYVNGGSQTITWPEAISGTDPVLQASGTDFVAFWSDDEGTTIYFTQTSII